MTKYPNCRFCGSSEGMVAGARRHKKCKQLNRIRKKKIERDKEKNLTKAKGVFDFECNNFISRDIYK